MDPSSPLCSFRFGEETGAIAQNSHARAYNSHAGLAVFAIGVLHFLEYSAN